MGWVRLKASSANMSGFTLQVRDYGKVIDENGVSGTKVYLKDGGPDDLPVRGDSFDALDPPPTEEFICFANKLRMRLHGNKQGLELWTVSYSSLTSPDAAEDAPENELFRSMTVGGELMNIGVQDGNHFLTGPADELDFAEFRKVTTASIQIKKVYKGFQNLLDRMVAYGGKLNQVRSPTFLTQAPETVQLDNARAQEYAKENGAKRWMVTFTFNMRIITGSADEVKSPVGAAITVDGAQKVRGGWNHLWDPKRSVWDATLKPTYTTAKIWKVLDAEPA